MLRFTTRDLLWLMVVIGLALTWLVTSHRSALIEARMQTAEFQAANCKAKFEELVLQNTENFATAEALLVTFKKADLTDEQRNEIRALMSSTVSDILFSAAVGPCLIQSCWHRLMHELDFHASTFQFFLTVLLCATPASAFQLLPESNHARLPNRHRCSSFIIQHS